MIYAIGEGPSGPLKIGRAGNPRLRLYQLQGGNPRPIRLLATGVGIPRNYSIRSNEWCDKVVERALHRVFRERHVLGEWFAVTLEEVLSVELPGASARGHIEWVSYQA